MLIVVRKINKAENSFLQLEKLIKIRFTCLAPNYQTIAYVGWNKRSISIFISVCFGTTCLSLDSKPMVRLILTTIWSIWCFQDKLLSIRIPKYFTNSLHSKATLVFCSLSNILILGRWVSFLWAGENMTKFVFFNIQGQFIRR